MSSKSLYDNQSADLFSFSNSSDLEEELMIENEEKITGLLKSRQIAMDKRFALKAEAYMLQLAYANNKILSLSNSRTRILAHQVESTYIVINSLNQRFILADEVGLGKTVEAGLIIKEMIYRYNYQKILIVCPASLLVQWQHEMEEKFSEKFEILDRKILEKKRKENGNNNPWKNLKKVICSLDFIKNENFEKQLSQTRWDVVIFDEAHRLRRDSQTTTLTYNVAELLSTRCNSLLLLTATPFRGKLEELYFLVRLVDKNLFGSLSSFNNEYCMPDSDLSALKGKLSTVLLRRTKKEIGGFTVRHARTIRFELYADEQLLYDETTRYVGEEFNKALQSENRAVGFVMTVFQKLLDSSSHALFSALSNRHKRLTSLLEKANRQLTTGAEADKILIEVGFEELSKELVDDYENADLIDDFVLQKTARELKEEISTLEKLLLIAKKITRSKKSEKLKEMMLRLRKEGHKKFLIFTQFRTTQNYLNEVLADFKVELFHGSLDKDQKELAIENFKSDIEVLICTEAGGEGRNMQFCNILFNYDLPWSPLKIEQRIGRLHRFGQKYDVFIYNFSTRGTVAERVLDVLIKKLNLFEESIGTPDIMLGQIEDELSLNSLFMDMVSGRKKSKIIDQEIELSINKAKKSFEKLEELTVTQKMDFNYDEYYKITRRERKFSNKQLQNFIERFCKCDKSGQKYFGKIDSDSGQIEIKNNLTDYKFHQYGTFDSEKALNNSKLEFLAFGHPSVDRCIKYSHSDEFGGMTGVQVINYKKKFYGLVFFYLITYSAISETKELIIVVVDPKEKLSDYELLEVEHEIIAQSGLNKAELNLSYKFKNMLDDIDNLNLKARDRILKKVEDKVWDIKENLDLAIDPEIEKISVSYGRQLSELNEKLAVQENKMRFEERDMKSAISRTKNLIAHTKEEMLQVLTRYQGYHSVKYKIALISAGLVKSI